MGMSRANWENMSPIQRTQWEQKQPMGAPGTTQEDRNAGIYSEEDINVKTPFIPGKDKREAAKTQQLKREEMLKRTKK